MELRSARSKVQVVVAPRACALAPDQMIRELGAALPVGGERLQQDAAILEHEDGLIQQALQDRRKLCPRYLIAASKDPFELA